MRILQLVIIAVVIAGLSFGIGYFIGAIKIGEMSSKVKSLAQELKVKDFRILLLQVKDHIRTGLASVSERNYGIAAQEINTAREVLKKGLENTTDKGRVVLGRIDSSLAQIQEDLESLNVKAAMDKIKTIMNNIDRALIAGI